MRQMPSVPFRQILREYAPFASQLRSLRLFSGFLPNWQNQEAESEFLNGLPLTLVVVSEWQGKLPPLRWLARARGIVAIFSYITRYS